jgi:hypothetical protein
VQQSHPGRNHVQRDAGYFLTQARQSRQPDPGRRQLDQYTIVLLAELKQLYHTRG